MRIRNERPSMPSTSGPRSTVASELHSHTSNSVHLMFLAHLLPLADEAGSAAPRPRSCTLTAPLDPRGWLTRSG